MVERVGVVLALLGSFGLLLDAGEWATGRLAGQGDFLVSGAWLVAGAVLLVWDRSRRRKDDASTGEGA